jgi:hypothetical protein
MTNETLAQTAQRLKDEGRFNFETKRFKIHRGNWLGLNTLKNKLFNYGAPNDKNSRQEVAAAIAVLDGSIVLDEPNPWRSVEDEEPPKDGTCILVYGSLLNEPKVVVWCCLNKGWRLAIADLGFEGTKSLILEYPFTHWMPLLAPPIVL